MYFIIGAGVFVSAIFLVAVSIPVIITLVREKRLLDSAEESRKIHLGATPTLGGLAIFIGFFVSISLSGYTTTLTWFPVFSGMLVVLLFAGLKDDILGISAKKKLLIEILAAAGITLIGGTVIQNFGGLFGVGEIPFLMGVAFSAFVIIVLTNAYNLIDGVDGLASGIAVIATFAFSFWFFAAGYNAHAIVCLALAGAHTGFLLFNFAPAKIFMGDTGSLVTGFILSILAVEAIGVGISTQGAPYQASMPVLVMAILSIPLYDTLRVFSIRALQGRSPFDPGNEHIHHEILKLGFGHRATCFILYSLNISIIGFVILFSFLPVTWLFFATVAFVALIFPSVGFKRSVYQSLFGMKLQHIANRKDYGQYEINRKIDAMKREAAVRRRRENTREEVRQKSAV